MMSKKVYLAGPMRIVGPPDYNREAFADAQRALEDLGYIVFNPHEHDATQGRDPNDIRSALADDLFWICTQADLMVILPGWEKSLGVAAEMATAQAINIPVYTLADILEPAKC